MQFTPQQLSGAGRYNAKVRVGNWDEDLRLEESKYQDFRRQKARGRLATTFRREKQQTALQSVPHSHSADGLLRFGDTIMLRNCDNGQVLANDVWEEIAFGTREYSVSAGPDDGPQARNTFVITRVDDSLLRDTSPQAYGGDEIVHYGEPFQLACNPSLRVDERTGMLMQPLFLASCIKTDTRSAKASSHQMVYMTADSGAQTVWRLQRVARGRSGGRLRVLSEGQAVPANEEVVVQHRATNQALYSDSKYDDITDFGPEREVSCHTKLSTSKSHNLVGEFKGLKTGDVPSRYEQATNKWVVVTAEDPEAAEDNRNLPPPLDFDALLRRTREIINERANHGIRGIARAFRIMDDGGDGRLDREDLKWGLVDYGVQFDDDQFNMLLDAFDRDGDGLVSFDEFLVTLRGPLSERRLRFIDMAFDLLDKTGDGTVTLEDLVNTYDTSFHPKVINGQMTHEEAITEFMEQWDQSKDGIVTRDEFHEYYKDVSASIDDEDYFELMMRNAWHISGGEGWCANTTCRRVLVVHTNGSQEVVEIENDLGLDDDDVPAMIRRLEQQGVRDIERISLAD